MPPISLYDKFIKFVLQDDKGTELDSIPVSRGLGLKQVLDELRGAFNTPPNTTIPLFKRELFIEDALDDHLVYVTDSAWRWIRGKRDIYQLIVQANPTTAAAPVRLRQQHSPTHSPSPPSSSSQDSGSVSSMRANAPKFHSGRARVCARRSPPRVTGRMSIGIRSWRALNVAESNQTLLPTMSLDVAREARERKPVEETREEKEIRESLLRSK